MPIDESKSILYWTHQIWLNSVFTSSQMKKQTSKKNVQYMAAAAFHRRTASFSNLLQGSLVSVLLNICFSQFTFLSAQKLFWDL